jgi:hypothetical protein
MKSLKELLIKAKTNNTTISSEADNWLIENGYIKTIAFGWEKPEYLEKFGISPNAKGIPAVQRDEEEIEYSYKEKRDQFGVKTGEKEAIPYKKKTGRKIWVTAPYYLAYTEFKKEMYKQWHFEKFRDLPYNL